MKNVKENLIRLNRFISKSGICNRREADNLIFSKKVYVNGKIIDKLGSKVLKSDIVKINGKILRPFLPSYILLNKPKNFSCDKSNDSVRTVFSILSKVKNLNTYNCELSVNLGHVGLVLISNENLNSEKNFIKQILHLKLKHDLEKDKLKKILQTKIKSKIIVKSVNYLKPNFKNEIGIEVFLKNIKTLENLFCSINNEITFLDRVTLSHLTKIGLARGQWRYLKKEEIFSL